MHVERGFQRRRSGNHRPVGGYSKTNLRSDVENQAPKFDMPSEMEARFARRAVDGETLGLSLLTLSPNFRIPFGHKHADQEEVYVVVRGSGRVKVEDEIVDLTEWDAIRFGVNTMRCMEAGPDGIEYVAFGAGDDPRDAEMAPNWWSD
jgi:mannose-6-phosphate isomerase-like protein (cupin superfamily)